ALIRREGSCAAAHQCRNQEDQAFEVRHLFLPYCRWLTPERYRQLLEKCPTVESGRQCASFERWFFCVISPQYTSCSSGAVRQGRYARSGRVQNERRLSVTIDSRSHSRKTRSAPEH